MRDAARCGLVISLLWLGPATAQTAQLHSVARELERNREELGLYGWKARTEITVAGELQQVVLVRVEYDRNGFLKETPVVGEAEPPHATGKLNKKTRAFHGELKELTDSYTALEPRAMRQALARAHAWGGQGEQGDALRIQARGVVREGDKLDLWVDTVSMRPRRLEVLTSLKGEPVRLTTEFAELEDGPSHATLTVVETELKEKKMLVRTKNFGYEKRGG